MFAPICPIVVNTLYIQDHRQCFCGDSCAWVYLKLELVTSNVHFTSSMSQELPYYTLTQLALRNGNDREDVWVCYKGYIYDVTKSRLWKDGTHYEHWGGQDLTEELSEAPHTENVFDKFQAIGKLSTT